MRVISMTGLGGTLFVHTLRRWTERGRHERPCAARTKAAGSMSSLSRPSWYHWSRCMTQHDGIDPSTPWGPMSPCRRPSPSPPVVSGDQDRVHRVTSWYTQGQLPRADARCALLIAVSNCLTVSLSQASRCTEIAWQVRANSLSKRCLPDRLMSPRPRKYPGLGVWTQVPISGHAAIFSVHDSPGSTSTPVWLVLRLLYLFPLKMVSAFKTFGVFSLAAGCRFLQSVND